MSKATNSFNSASATWEEHRTAFFEAIDNSDRQTIETVLLKYPEAVEWQDAKGRRPLHLSFEKRDLDTFLLLLDKNASPEQQSNRTGFWAAFAEFSDISILQSATRNGEKQFIIPLLQRGASTSSVNGAWAPKKVRYEIDDLLKRAGKIAAEYAAQKQSAVTPPVTQTTTPQSIGQKTDIEVLKPVKVKNRPAQPTG